jgi:hypothetical protein
VNIKELAEGTSGPVRATLLALEAKVMMLEHDLAESVEQHEAFKQEVSDALLRYHAPSHVPHGLQGFIITKPDPLVDVLKDFGGFMPDAEDFRAALEARGLEIRSKNDD